MSRQENLKDAGVLLLIILMIILLQVEKSLG